MTVVRKANDSLKSAKKAFDEKLNTYMTRGKSAIDSNLSEVMN